MGSSLSPAMSNIFMEHFETSLMDDIIPANMKPLFWMRYVDDVLCCFEDLSTLDDFLTLLNSIRETITFTVELSRTSEADGFPLDLPANVCESLPFLELNVMRLTDGTYTFSIFRKPCHVGNYIHAYSYQPLFQKQSVIRSLFLRAFRYCDPQFLPSEEERIRQDFSKLGYTAKFIEEGRRSALKGRNSEVGKDNMVALQQLPFAINRLATDVKKEPTATLSLPYHPTMMKLRPRLNQMGIRLTFSSNSSLQQQLRRRSPTCTQPKGSVYVINCSACKDVYVGQTGKQIASRMNEHVTGNQDILGAVRRHNSNQGHHMDLLNPTQVFHSDCVNTRLTVEAALIHAAPTVKNNTASTSVSNNELVAPIICKSTRFNWTQLANCIPDLPLKAVPWYKRRFFGNPVIPRPPRHLRSDAVGTPIAHSTRSRRIARSHLNADLVYNP